MENRLTFMKNFSTEFEDTYILLSDLHIFPKIYARTKTWLLEERDLPDSQFTKADLNRHLNELSEVRILREGLIKLINICEFNLKSDFVETLRAKIKMYSFDISLENIQEKITFKNFLQNEISILKKIMVQTHKIMSSAQMATELSGSIFKNDLGTNIDYAQFKLSAFKYDLIQQDNAKEVVLLLEQVIGDLRDMIIIKKQSKGAWITNSGQLSPEQQKYFDVETHAKTNIDHIIKLLKNEPDYI